MGKGDTSELLRIYLAHRKNNSKKGMVRWSGEMEMAMVGRMYHHSNLNCVTAFQNLECTPFKHRTLSKNYTSMVLSLLYVSYKFDASGIGCGQAIPVRQNSL